MPVYAKLIPGLLKRTEEVNAKCKIAGKDAIKSVFFFAETNETYDEVLPQLAGDDQSALRQFCRHHNWA
jgi:hypothetical protein